MAARTSFGAASVGSARALGELPDHAKQSLRATFPELGDISRGEITIDLSQGMRLGARAISKTSKSAQQSANLLRRRLLQEQRQRLLRKYGLAPYLSQVRVQVSRRDVHASLALDDAHAQSMIRQLVLLLCGA